jgi:hypothetical protein
LGHDQIQYISQYLTNEKAFLINEEVYAVIHLQGTSVPCDKMFSTAGDIDTAQRFSFNTNLIFLKKNIHEWFFDGSS